MVAVEEACGRFLCYAVKKLSLIESVVEIGVL